MVLTVWALAFAFNTALRWEMEKTISAQQFSAVSLAAKEIDTALRERIRALDTMSRDLGAWRVNNPVAVQVYLEQRVVAPLLFNWGVFVTDRYGMAIASTPAKLGRAGTPYGDNEFIRHVLATGVPQISDPLIGKRTGQPVFAIAVPVRNAQGDVVGVLVGVTNLAQPNFLDDIGGSKYGRTGDFVVTAPRSRVYVASSDKRRVMQAGPAPGVNPIYDRYIAGQDGSGVAVSSRGIEELSSSVRIPSSGWLMQAVLPTAEAFAPSDYVQRTLVLIAASLTVLVVLLGGWWLRRELRPLENAALQLGEMSRGERPREALPVHVDDEIGALVSAFNRLLAVIRADEMRAVEYAANERVHRIVAHVPGVVFQYRLRGDGSGCFPFISDGVRDIFGIEPDELTDTSEPIRALMHPQDAQRFFASLHASAHQLQPWRIEYRIRRHDGGQKWVQVNAVPEAGPEDAVTWYGFITDVTQTKAMEEELRVAAAAFETQEGILVTDADGRIVRVNPAFTAITGFSLPEVIGHSPAILKSLRHDARFYEGMWAALHECGHWQGEIWNRRKNGEVYPEWLTISVVRDEAGVVTHYVGIFQDITARKAAEDEIRNLAFYDPLTHLPNRRLLLDRLRQTLALTARNRQHAGLFFLDLDHFKLLNDTLGHDIGDELLVAVAQRLLGCVREGDTVARLGGDEFIVMLEGLSAERAEAMDQAEKVAHKILAKLNEPYALRGHRYSGTPSLGLTLFRGHEQGVDDILKQADIAMYAAKSAGRNTYKVFTTEMA